MHTSKIPPSVSARWGRKTSCVTLSVSDASHGAARNPILARVSGYSRYSTRYPITSEHSAVDVDQEQGSSEQQVDVPYPRVEVPDARRSRAHAWQPERWVRTKIVAVHSCPQVWHRQGSFALDLARYAVGSQPSASAAASGYRSARDAPTSGVLRARAPAPCEQTGQPDPLTRFATVASHS